MSNQVSINIGYNSGQPRISGSTLLEKGVDPEIVKTATSRTPYDTFTPKIIPTVISGGSDDNTSPDE